MNSSRQQAVGDLIEATELKVGINLGNSLLVTGETVDGEPEGVAPGMGRALAHALGVEVKFVTYASPGKVADAAPGNEWDIGLIALDPERALVIDFCDAYVEIAATYLVAKDSPIQSIEDADRPGVRIAISARSAYDLFLSRHLQHAELVRGEGLQGAYQRFIDEGLEALAGLLPALKTNAESLPGSRIIDGSYTTVRQAIGTRPGKQSLNAFSREFIAEAKTSGLIAGLIQRHGVSGKLQVAALN